jgi:hypothetical protein
MKQFHARSDGVFMSGLGFKASKMHSSWSQPAFVAGSNDSERVQGAAGAGGAYAEIQHAELAPALRASQASEMHKRLSSSVRRTGEAHGRVLMSALGSFGPGGIRSRLSAQRGTICQWAF